MQLHCSEGCSKQAVKAAAHNAVGQDHRAKRAEELFIHREVDDGARRAGRDGSLPLTHPHIHTAPCTAPRLPHAFPEGPAKS